MIALLGSFIGLLGGALPDLLKLYRDAADRKHELTILQMQMQQQKQKGAQRLEEIHAQADIAESKALYRTYHTGIAWVDALNGTVRPVLAYAFFLLYAAVKTAQFISLDAYSAVALMQLWNPEDQAIFASVISFYFGQRAMSKFRAGH